MTVAHVVALRRPEERGESELSAVVDELARIASLSGAISVHHGPNIAPTEYAAGVGLGFVAVFSDNDALAAYLDAPEHLAAATRLAGTDVIVIDVAAHDAVQEKGVHA